MCLFVSGSIHKNAYLLGTCNIKVVLEIPLVASSINITFCRYLPKSKCILVAYGHVIVTPFYLLHSNNQIIFFGIKWASD